MHLYARACTCLAAGFGVTFVAIASNTYCSLLPTRLPYLCWHSLWYKHRRLPQLLFQPSAFVAAGTLAQDAQAGLPRDDSTRGCGRTRTTVVAAFLPSCWRPVFDVHAARRQARQRGGAVLPDRGQQRELVCVRRCGDEHRVLRTDLAATRER